MYVYLYTGSEVVKLCKGLGQGLVKAIIQTFRWHYASEPFLYDLRQNY